MKIYKKDDKVIVELDLYQKENNCYKEEEELGTVLNLIGVKAGDDMTISHLCDLSYKGDQQEGESLVHYSGYKNDFIRLCHELGIDFIEHWVCCDCNKPIYGAATMKDEGFQCFDCNYKQEEQ